MPKITNGSLPYVEGRDLDFCVKAGSAATESGLQVSMYGPDYDDDMFMLDITFSDRDMEMMLDIWRARLTSLVDSTTQCLEAHERLTQAKTAFRHEVDKLPKEAG